MKKIYVILLIFLFNYSNSFAQDIAISESSVMHNGLERASLSVLITPDTKEVKKKWKDFMGDKYDVDVKGIGFLTNKDILTSEQIQLDKITSKQLDLYAKVVEENNQTRINLFAAPGYDIYINPNSSPNAFNGMRSILVEFLNYYLPEYYQEGINDAQEKYADLADTKTELEDDIDNNINDINELKKEIEELKGENKSLEDELVDTKQKLIKAEQQLKEKKQIKRQVNQQIDAMKAGS